MHAGELNKVENANKNIWKACPIRKNLLSNIMLNSFLRKHTSNLPDHKSYWYLPCFLIIDSEKDNDAIF